MKFIKEHPVISAVVGFIAAGVPWLQAGWALVSDKPMFEVLGNKLGPLPAPSGWLAIALGGLGLILLAAIVYQLTQTAEAYKRRVIVSSLVVLRELAVHTLLNRSVGSDADLQQLKRDIDLWQNSVLKQLDDFGNQSDVTYFRVLGTYQPQNLHGSNAEHQREKDMLAERLNRLLEIMRRIERG